MSRRKIVRSVKYRNPAAASHTLRGQIKQLQEQIDRLTMRRLHLASRLEVAVRQCSDQAEQQFANGLFPGA